MRHIITHVSRKQDEETDISRQVTTRMNLQSALHSRSLQNENVEHSESENDEEDLESFVQVQFVSF